jgi:hypothetical protein
MLGTIARPTFRDVVETSMLGAKAIESAMITTSEAVKVTNAHKSSNARTIRNSAVGTNRVAK